jgi:hypothetical protein
MKPSVNVVTVIIAKTVQAQPWKKSSHQFE